MLLKSKFLILKPKVYRIEYIYVYVSFRIGKVRIEYTCIEFAAHRIVPALLDNMFWFVLTTNHIARFITY